MRRRKQEKEKRRGEWEKCTRKEGGREGEEEGRERGREENILCQTHDKKS